MVVLDITMKKLFNIHPSAGTFNTLTDGQNKGIAATQIIIFILGGLLLFLWMFNFVNYIIKRKRYQEISILLFYLNAVIIIIEVLIDTCFVPDTDFCAYQQILGVYGTQILFLNLGIC